MIQAKVHSTIFWKTLVHFQPKFTDLLQNRQNKIFALYQDLNLGVFLSVEMWVISGNKPLERPIFNPKLDLEFFLEF